MSLMYHAFGVPTTLDEFFEKAGKQENEVIVTVGRYPSPMSFIYKYFIRLDAGHTSFVMDNFSVGKLDPEAETKIKLLESQLIQRAQKIQHVLSDKGLESKLLSGNGVVINWGCPGPTCDLRGMETTVQYHL